MRLRAAKVSHQGVNVTFTRRARILTGRNPHGGFCKIPGPSGDGPSGSHSTQGHPIGVRKARFRASLPSEPDWRFSRIRLSGRWFTVKRDR